jgi:hypothetical protein
MAPTPVGLSIQQLKREIDALQGLPEGRLPQQIRLPALFEIDLADPAAVSERVDTLQARAATQVAPAADEMAALRLTRDGLRLQFLHLPMVKSEQGGVPAPNYHTGPMQ